MKKILYIVLLAGACLVPANNVSAQNVTPKTELDSIAYIFGYSQSEGLLQAVEQSGVDAEVMADFYRGFSDGALKAENKQMSAYITGIQFGQIVAQRMVPGLSEELFGKNSTEKVSLEQMLAGLFAGLNKENVGMTIEQATEYFEQKINEMKARQSAPVIELGKKYMEEYAKQPDVKKLPCGVLYKVLQEGNGALPVESSKVKVHYEGKLIDGKVFDSSYERGEPTTFGVTQVIKGWTETLKAMPVGSKWEVVIPQELAYGERSMGSDIKPYSTLIFTIELLGIE